MLVCRQGLKDGNDSLYDYGNFQVIKNEKGRYFYSEGIILKVSDISSNVLDKLVYAINKGIRYFFLEGYLLQYIPSFGYGNYFIFKTEIKDEELNNKSLQLLEGKVSEDEYIGYLMKYQGAKGETIGVIDEFYTLTNELRLPKYEPMELTQCKELEVKFEDKYVEIFNVRFRILDIPYFNFLSKYISVLQIIKGSYKGEIKTSSGEGIIYHEINKIKNLTFSFTKICGKYRLDTPENCIIGDGISFHTKNKDEISQLMYCLENLKTLRDSLNL